MAADLSQAKALFLAVLDRPGPERSAYLASRCGDDVALRRRVEAMLAAHEASGELLPHAAVEMLAGDDVAAVEATSAFGSQAGTPSSPGETTQGEESPMGGLAPSSRADHPGRIDHYEVVELLGKGGFGTVYRALDTKLHRVVAIKVLAPELAASAAARKRFIREARTAAAVKNDHVVAIHSVEDDHQPPYIVMEYVDGVTLQGKLDKEGALELKEILRIGMQMAEGLAAAHRQGFLHRDIKPANILLENGVQRVKITDFGLARAVDDASVTQSGVIAGTPMYMSPEQAEGLPLDHRSDLFSLGTVLYVMCTGRPPFRASGTMAILKRVCEETPRPIREINGEMPQWLCDVVEKLHAKKPEERFESAKEVAELLAEHLADVQAGRKLDPALRLSKRTESAQRPEPSTMVAVGQTLASTRSRWPRVMLGLAMLAVFATAAFFWWRSQRPAMLVLNFEHPIATVVLEGEAIGRREFRTGEPAELPAGKCKLSVVVNGRIVQAEEVLLVAGERFEKTIRPMGRLRIINDSNQQAAFCGPSDSNPFELSTLRSRLGEWEVGSAKQGEFEVLAGPWYWMRKKSDLEYDKGGGRVFVMPGETVVVRVPDKGPTLFPDTAEQVLPALAGSWKGVYTQKIYGGKPALKKISAVAVNDWIVGRTWLRQRVQMEDEGFQSVTAFEPGLGTFRDWFFHSRGLIFGPSTARWDAATRTLTWTNLPEAGVVLLMTLRFVDADTLSGEILIRDKEGKALFEMSSHMTRTTDKITIDEHFAAGPLPREMEVLDRTVGDWETTAVIKNAKHPDGLKATWQSSVRKILGGRLIATDRTGYPGDDESYSLATFDTYAKAYGRWSFRASGNVMEYGGLWDEKSQTLKWHWAGKDGSQSSNTWPLHHPNRRDWQVVTKDALGKITFEVEATSVRRDEPGWVRLFHGKDLEGWTPATREAWQVADGAIIGKKHDALHTSKQHRIFELRLEYRVIGSGPGVNTHGTVRWQIPSGPDGKLELPYAPLIKLLRNNEIDFTFQGPKELVGGRGLPGGPPSRDGWNELHVVCSDARIEVMLNGKLSVTQLSEAPKIGHLSLTSQPPGIQFRNIRIKEGPP